MPLHDQLIEFAREKQRKRCCVSVHKSVSNPIVVLVIGDKRLDELEALYTQLKSRWSGQLNALQVCYCYVKAPYTGPGQILQAKLELPDGRGGPGALCALPDTLAAVNAMMAQAIDQVSQETQVQMMQAGIHIVLSPEDPAGALLSDLAAVAKGRLEDFGVIMNDCRLYLMLPKSYQTADECRRVCSVMDQLREAGRYEQAVLQPLRDAVPRICRIDRLINAVMLLDELNENYQYYNAHGERLGLRLDLVENGWIKMGFIQTAGVREGGAGPEYWLARAASQLCFERQAGSKRGGEDDRFQVVSEKIAVAVQARSRGAEQALRSCCLFRPGQVGRVARLPLDEGESAVFGGALHAAYAAWRGGLPEPEIPGEVSRIVEEIESDGGLDALAGQLEDWAGGLEERPAQMPDAYCPQLDFGKGEAGAACRFRDTLWAEKYLPLVKREERDCCVRLARLCAKYCRERREELRSEEEEFTEFAKEVRQVWLTLQEAYTSGRKLEPKWLGKPPSPGALRKAGALALRTGDPTEALAMVAECVDLSGTEAEGIPQADPLLFCRILFADGLNTRVQPITQGVSTGRVLKFAVISQEYDEEALRRVYAIKYAWENQAAD